MNLTQYFIYGNMASGICLAGWISMKRGNTQAKIPAVDRRKIAIWLLTYTGFSTITLWRWTNTTPLPAGSTNLLQACLELGLLACWIIWMIPASSLVLRSLGLSLVTLPYLLGWTIETEAIRQALQFQWISLCLVIGSFRFYWPQVTTTPVIQVCNLLSNDFYFGTFLLGMILQSLSNTLIFFTIPSLLASFCTWIIIAGCFSFSIVPFALAKATLCYPKPHSNFS